MSESEAVMMNNTSPPGVEVPGDDTPTAKINPEALKALGYNLTHLFTQYRSDRRIQELRWLRNLRQYLGYYDPEVESQLSAERSRAFPKITRVKCITMLAQIMELMFPSDDRNWTLAARPSPDMSKDDLQKAIAAKQALDQASGGPPPTVDMDYVMEAIQELATERARALATEIEDQLEELGGDQSYDYVALNQEALASGILYGLGVLEGPYAREVETTTWTMQGGQPVGKRTKSYMPQFDVLSVWEFYPDLAAKRLEDGDGYFKRKVMSRSQVRDLADRPDFFADVIKDYLKSHQIGNYRPQEFETELRSMGVKMNVNETKIETTKFEIIIWKGKVDGTQLINCGVEVPESKLANQVDAEVWLLDGYVIRAIMNPWADLGVDVKTAHYFVFDRDDTAPIGFGLPNVIRDTQMSISAATRMLLDNASVVCGPMLEMNTALLRPDQDLTAIAAYKTFYRDDEGLTAQWPAVRNVEIDGHIQELSGIIELFLKFIDLETFTNPLAGGDPTLVPGEPMRNAAGASMMFGKASLPFKQVIRNFDRFTMSIIQSLVQFNRQFNPKKAPVADYDVIARGATSLIAKEVRGMQIDSLVTTLTPQEMLHVDDRKLAEARFRVRDLDDMLVGEAEANRRKKAQDDAAAQQQQQQNAYTEANIRQLVTAAFKNVTQGSKNMSSADATVVQSAIAALESGLQELQRMQQPNPAQLAGAEQQVQQENTPPAPAPGGAPSDDPSQGGGGPPLGVGMQ